MRLGEDAKECGYQGDLCTFLDDIDLEGAGIGPVARALVAHLPEETVIKIALANRWILFSRVYTERMLAIGIKPDYEYTLEDWAAEGEEEFNKHCDENGRFRFEDFKPKPFEMDVEKIERLRKRIRSLRGIKD